MKKKLSSQDIYTLLFRLEQATDRIAQTALWWNKDIRRLMGDSYKKPKKRTKNS